MAEKIKEARSDVNRKLIDQALEKELNDLGINLDSQLDDKPTRANDNATRTKTPVSPLDHQINDK